MTKQSAEMTPMMRQFHEFKQQHPDALLLFRCGDFYETYFDDAVEASRILGITLTQRSNGKSTAQHTAMAGFPYHALDTYLPRLVRAGRRVAICDQLEDPKLTKKLVKRGITELVTPGVALTDGVLHARENNFLAAVHFGASGVGLALLDVSTGEFLVAEGTPEHVDKLIEGFGPKEILFERGRRERFASFFGNKHFTYELDDWAFSQREARTRLLERLGVRTLKGFGIDHLQAAVTAAGAALSYLELTNHTQLGHIRSVRRIEEESFVRLDKFTIRNLELVAPMAEDGRSLFDVVDRTLTPMGARMLRRNLLFPLRSAAKIRQRLDGTEAFFRHRSLKETCADALARLGDLERVVSKIAVHRVSPREMRQLGVALEAVGTLHEAVQGCGEEALAELSTRLDACPELIAEIRHTLVEEPAALIGKGDVIAAGVSDELDELRAISQGGKDYLLKLQQAESEATGIPSLKIGYNNIFGYYIEVRNAYKAQVPPQWIRKQTLAQAERYITEELKRYEERILGAEDRILALESRIFAALVERTGTFIAQLQRSAAAAAEIDGLHSAAAVAAERRYVRPVVDESTVLDIRGGRHPVIETMLPAGEEYVPNDVLLDTDNQQILIVTGPNMAGKSALLRQTALITLLAQSGSFVPAESARIGLTDKIFTRVGASDNISAGESTFMVEMSEAANIMNSLTPRSLVLFDELGRGTSTYDGISIAWSIVEHIHENPALRARTLFATHYHELNEMERLFPRIGNCNVSVREQDGRIVFLRTLKAGGSEHSFGIQVARLAGMPASIVSRAGEVMARLENERRQTGSIGRSQSAEKAGGGQTPQLNFFQLDDPVLRQVRDEIIGLDINALTPIEALNKLNEIRKIVCG